MAKLTRATQKLFGSSAGTGQIAEYGSAAASGFAGGTTYSGTTATPANIQALSAWLEGWFTAVDGLYNPAIEDVNAVDWLYSYQLCYLFQAGVAEWDSGTTYYLGSLVNDGSGGLYRSLINTNLNHALTVEADWLLVTAGTFLTKAANYTAKTYEKLFKVSTTHNETLPDATLCEGMVYKYWKTDAVGTTVTFLTQSAQTMSGVASGGVTLTEQYSWAEFTSDGSNWLVRNG